MGEPLKALSIRQPWAHAIVHLGKTIENRDWRGCSYRGPILIHASSNIGTGAEFNDNADAARLTLFRAGEIATLQAFERMPLLDIDTRRPKLPRWRPGPEMHLGGIVGRAQVVGTVEWAPNVDIGDFDWRVHEVSTQCVPRDLTSSERAWWTGGFALVLADVKPVPFVPCKGALGLFNVLDDVVRAVESARGAA